ncbi:MAG: hypothetical protein KKB59_14295 [Spirochaetes bacterium]|nr:hypothetical protein [Spirochaetota bacterium]
MATPKEAEGRGRKPRGTKPNSESIYVPIKVSKRASSRMRIIAATEGISFAEISRRLLDIGIDEYLKEGHIDIGALAAMESASSAARGTP